MTLFWLVDPSITPLFNWILYFTNCLNYATEKQLRWTSSTTLKTMLQSIEWLLYCRRPHRCCCCCLFSPIGSRNRKRCHFYRLSRLESDSIGREMFCRLISDSRSTSTVQCRPASTAWCWHGSRQPGQCRRRLHVRLIKSGERFNGWLTLWGQIR